MTDVTGIPATSLSTRILSRLSGNWNLWIGASIIILVLLWRPQGLFGSVAR